MPQRLSRSLFNGLRLTNTINIRLGGLHSVWRLSQMASSARQQPHWQQPSQSEPAISTPPLKIWNSLTRKKEAFVPIDPAGKAISWYACGPTVYEMSHLGHARNYVTTDIIRRILQDHFGYKLTFVMNITDIDDKIITRARQQSLFAGFKTKHPQVDKEVLQTSRKAFDGYLAKNLSILPEATSPETYPADLFSSQYKNVLGGKNLAGDGAPGDAEAKLKMHFKTASTAAGALTASAAAPDKIIVDDFYRQVEDVLLPYLDNLHGSSINANDHGIFTKLTQKYEQLFFKDMDDLGNLRPDTITRVTEFGPQIVKFVERIIANGFAYPTSDGSVYFDITAFEKAGNPYARLEPWNRGDQSLMADGEGSLTKKSTEKKGDADFALWKASKPGEPAWPSPWGPGRPGWHIECSVMASEAIGPVLDIHSGGIDLAFPHHDNELAQAEAYWVSDPNGGCASHGGHQWVNYFLHMGHLSIAGAKMSKSLKNFTTISDALARGDWTPRGLRVVFLMGGWRDGIEITDDVVKAGTGWEDRLQNFFLKAVDAERSALIAKRHDEVVASTSSEGDDKLRASLAQAKTDLHTSLCDSFNTPQAMRVLSDLVTDFNSLPTNSISTPALLETARWVTKIVRTFGLDTTTSLADPRIGWAGVSIAKEAQEFVYPLSALRDTVRHQARAKPFDSTTLTTSLPPSPAPPSHDSPYASLAAQFQHDIHALATSYAPASSLLKLCDELRDIHLWDLGIYLEDRDAQPALVRPVDHALRAARSAREADKVSAASAKADAKARREEEERVKRAALDERAKLSHLQMFRGGDEYSTFDDDGVPILDKAGEPLPKARRKKLVKEWERQKKIHEEWAKSQ